MYERKTRSDRGKKRAGYDSSGRRARKLARDLVRTETAQRRAEQAEQRAGRPRSERRAEGRLVELPSDMVCPVCELTVLGSRRWVVGQHEVHDATCLACHRRLANGMSEEECQQVAQARHARDLKRQSRGDTRG